MYIFLAERRTIGLEKWSDTDRPSNDDDDDSGGATPIAITEPPQGDDETLKEPPRRPWIIPGVGDAL